VVGRFNSHLEDCILFVADEAYWGGDKRCVGKLQTQITEPMIAIEHKGINRYLVRNMLHHLMLAEPGWVIPAGRFERRYAAITVSKARLGETTAPSASSAKSTVTLPAMVGHSHFWANVARHGSSATVRRSGTLT
jgi:hypothetical protein